MIITANTEIKRGSWGEDRGRASFYRKAVMAVDGMAVYARRRQE